MPHPTDLEITVYSKNYEFLDAVSNPLDGTEFTPKFNGTGVGTITVAPGSLVNEALREDGSRVVVLYRGEVILSGPTREDEGELDPRKNVTYTIEGDNRVLDNTLALVAPANPLNPAALSDLGQAQRTGEAGSAGTTTGQAGHFIWPGNLNTAESLIKHICAVNLTRLARPVSVLPDLGRGGDARAGGLLSSLTPRNGSLAEEIAPILDWSDLGIRVWQEHRGTGLLLDTFVPETWPSELDFASGALSSGTWNRHNPTATRVVVGGPGEGPERAFFGLVNAELEAQYNDVIEVFVDATGASLEWPESLADQFRVAKYYLLRPEISADLKTQFLSYIEAAARKKLEENKASASIAAALAETPAFTMFGDGGMRPGDLVPIATPGGPIAQRISSATLSLSNGLTVTPNLGNATTDEDEDLWEAIASIASGLRRLSRSV